MVQPQPHFTLLWVLAIPAKAVHHILYSNSLKWKLNVIPNRPNSGNPDFELNIKFDSSVKGHDMMNLYVPRGSWEQILIFSVLIMLQPIYLQKPGIK